MKSAVHNIFFLICLACLTLVACNQDKPVKALEPKDFQAEVQKQQGVVLDVRTPEEFQEGHLPEAHNIDYKGDIFKGSLEQLDKNKPYYVYCKSGVRSRKAAEIMQEMGFTQVYNMEGGIDAWKKEGRPLNN